MARQPRIQFPGAIYHVMARGNQRSEIFVDDQDREVFLDTLDETCQRSGFEIYAWVMMGNHYHFALHTPEGNLVDGMKWFQNTYTRRFNQRHQSWGRLYGDRYKAVLVQQGGRDDVAYLPAYDGREPVNETRRYLRRLIDYIHLNPAEAGLVRLKARGRAKPDPMGLLAYPWSSLTKGYAVAPSKRPNWLMTDLGFDRVGLPDTVAGRKKYVKRLEELATGRRDDRDSESSAEEATGTLESGWYWGSQAFGEALRETFMGTVQSADRLKGNSNYRGSEMGRHHDEAAARRWIDLGVEHFDLGVKGVASLGRGDPRRVAIAWAIWKNTTVPLKWIAEALHWTTAANVSNQVRMFRNKPRKEHDKIIREWIQKC